jgi:hypothetical protein
MHESKFPYGTNGFRGLVHMFSRLMIAGTFALLLQIIWIPIVRGESKSIEGTYRNPALGYSIKIPRGLKGVTGDQDGPERGVRIPLASGGEIVVFGEPNSLEWKSPEEGMGEWIGNHLKKPTCNSGERKIERVRVGRLNGAKGTLICGDRVLKVLLAFRSSGGPIYWIRLETLRVHQSEDEAVLETVAGSFKLIRWM